MDSIEGMKCPECGHTETFLIESGERGPDSLCSCGNQSGDEDCDFSGTVADFVVETATEPVKHTPGPWRLVSGEVWRDNTPIARMDRDFGNDTTPEERDANAHHIVLAVNCHDDLLAACKAALVDVAKILGLFDECSYLEDLDDLGVYSTAEGIRDRHAAAIANAESKPTC